MAVDIEDIVSEAKVKFTKSDVTVTWRDADNLSILQLAEKAGLKPRFGCRSAICGSCEVKVVRGRLYGPEGDEPSAMRICYSFPASPEVDIEL